MKPKLFSVVSIALAVSVAGQLATSNPALSKKSSASATTNSSAAPASTSAAPTGKKLDVKLVVSSPVKAGANATATVETSPNALCKIAVKLKSGNASSKGLENTHADASGKATWTWKVAANTAVGDWPVEVTSSLKGAKGSASGTLKVTK